MEISRENAILRRWAHTFDRYCSPWTHSSHIQQNLLPSLLKSRPLIMFILKTYVTLQHCMLIIQSASSISHGCLTYCENKSLLYETSLEILFPTCNCKFTTKLRKFFFFPIIVSTKSRCPWHGSSFYEIFS